MEVDVLVIGGGPAGSTTARFCAANGLDVLVVDRRREIGHPVQCGELLPHVEEMYTILPKSERLEELLSIPREYIMGRSERIEIVSPSGRIYGLDFKSFTLDRRSFDKYLVELAVKAGARLETNASFLGLRQGVAVTSMGEIRAKVIVGADGPGSRVARATGMGRNSMLFPAITCQADADFEPVVRMYFGSVAPGGYAWVIPKETGANVGLGLNPRIATRRPKELLMEFLRFIGSECREMSMGLVPASGPVKTTVRGNVLLVGDSAGHVMATNGGGIPTAMIAGRIAGNTIAEHLAGTVSLSEYESRWQAVMGKPLRTAERTLRLAGFVFPRDSLLSLAMFMLGSRGLDRTIRCKRPVL